MGTRVCNHLKANLREYIDGAKAAEYMVDKMKQFTEESFFATDWRADETAMKPTPLNPQHCVTKFESGSMHLQKYAYMVGEINTKLSQMEWSCRSHYAYPAMSKWWTFY